MKIGQLLWLGLFLATSCGTVRPYYSEGYNPAERSRDDGPSYTVYLVGDAGDLHEGDTMISDIRNRLAEDPDHTTLSFLGDNIYHHGLPSEDDPDREEKEKILLNQMKIGRNPDVKTFFIPGNHDWDDAGEDGLIAVRRQEKMVESYLNDGNSFLPDNGCPGPATFLLADDLLLVAIDTQWWLHKYDIARADGDGCAVSTREEFALELQSVIEDNRGRRIILAGHHPVHTNGEHGGYFGWQDHIFPLLNVEHYLYLPLPVIGSIYPLSRKAGVSRQDTPSKKFVTFSALMDSLFQLHPYMLYVSGHDHNLQYFGQGSIKQVVSGAGSKVNYARRGKGADFVYQGRGYSRMSYYENGEMWLEFFAKVKDDKYESIYLRRVVEGE